MIKRFLVKMLFSALFLLAFTLKYVDVSIGERLYEHPLESAWKTTGLRLETVSTEAWMKVNDNWLTVYELKKLAEKIQTKLGLKSRIRPSSGAQNGCSYLSVEGIRRDNTVITVTLQSGRGGELYETQLGVYTVNGGSVKQLRSYLNELRAAITGLGENASFAILMEGNYQGKLSPSLSRELTGKVFRKLQAETVETSFQAEGSLARGYSKLLGDAVYYDSRHVNVEVNTIYDRERRCTEVILATPNSTDGA